MFQKKDKEKGVEKIFREFLELKKINIQLEKEQVLNRKIKTNPYQMNVAELQDQLQTKKNLTIYWGEKRDRQNRNSRLTTLITSRI